MKNGIMVVLVLAALACAAGLAWQNMALRTSLKAAQQEIEQKDAQLDRLQQVSESQAEDTAERIAALQEDLTETRTLMQEAAAPDAAPPADAAEAPAPVEEPAETDATPQRGAMERAQRAQMDALLGLVYNDLLAQWDLPEDAMQRVRDHLIDFGLESQIAAMTDMNKGTLTAKEAQAHQDEIDKKLRDALSKELDRDELAQWDAYDEVADESLYRVVLDGQLTMLSPGLTEQNRWAVRDVFAEELTAHLDAFNQSDTIYNRDNFNQAQLDALNAGLVRLSETMDADQYGQAESFVQQAANTFQQMAGS